MLTSRPHRNRLLLALTCLAGIQLALAGGCAMTGGRHEPDAKPLAGSDHEQASRLLEQVLRYQTQGQWRQVVKTTGVMLDYHRDDPSCAQALAAAVPAALKTGDSTAALGLARIYLAEFPSDARLVPTLLDAVSVSAAAADSLAAAEFQLMAFTADPEAVMPSASVPAPLTMLDALDPIQLGRLADLFPGQATATLLGYHRVRALLRSGVAAQAREVAAALAADAPDDPWAAGALDLASGSSGQAFARPAILGLLAPLSGRYAGFGLAMQEAAHLALKDAGAPGDSTWALEVKDTSGDPVAAAKVARALCARPEVGVLVGALRTGTTVAAALVADQAGVPLVSPTATNEQIESLGAAVFQTNMNDTREIRQLAELAVRILDKKRAAILGPDTPNGHHLAGLFREQVEAQGGEVVAQAYFPPAVTDFRAQILMVKATRPEVVYVPASFEQMALLGPQLDFYHLASLVLGSSSWSMARPTAQQTGSLEGTIFPDAQARFPAAWTASFQAHWDAAAFAADQTAVARSTYLAVRKVINAGVGMDGHSRPALCAALRRPFKSGSQAVADTLSPVAAATGLLLVRSGQTMAFPGKLFTEALAAGQPAGAAGADSTGAVMGPVPVPAPGRKR